MKKIISIVLSLVMLLSVSAAATSVFAADNVQSIESTTKMTNPIHTEVNGNETDEVKVTPDKDDPTKITFTYTGDGDLQGWEFPGITEGQEYIIVSEEGNSITIQIINGYKGPITANAIVKEDTTSKKKKNNKKKSPKTGAAAGAAIAAAGAGIAVLAATKKRDED
ncbi:MAG: hypothetical protein E7520_06445 [Ruminococcaceae bacterium]|nr:hypothetical protein [Oscillospiraceae bacterium]